MANRFWVPGGSGNTNSTTNWSATSGGSSGASVPTSGDDAYWDGNSGSGTVTVNATLSVRTFDMSMFAGSLTVTSNVSCGGHFRLGSGMGSVSGSGILTLAATTDNGGVGWDVNLGGKALGGACNVNGNGGRWEQSSAFACASTFTRSAGTWNSNSYALTVGTFTSSGGTARGGNFGTSLITCVSTNTSLAHSGNNDSTDISTAVFDIRATANIPTYNGKTPGEIRVTAAGYVHVGSPPGTVDKIVRTISGSVQSDGIVFSGDVTCNTLELTGSSNPNLLRVMSTYEGGTRTITAGATTITGDVSFQDITAAGAAAPFTGAGLMGDEQGNSGITFTASATQTRDSGSGAWGSAARWTSRVPLPQDDVVIGATAGAITSTNVACMGRDLDMSAYANTMTITSTSTPYRIYGGVKLGGSTNNPNTCYVHLKGRGTHEIWSYGNQFWVPTSNASVVIYSPGGTYKFMDRFETYHTSTVGQNVVQVLAGTLDLGTGLEHRLFRFDSTDPYNRARQIVAGAGTRVDLWATRSTFTLSFGTSAQGCTVDPDLHFRMVTPSAQSRTIVLSGQRIGRLDYELADSPGGLYFGSQGQVDDLRLAAGSMITINNTNRMKFGGTLTGQQFGYQVVGLQTTMTDVLRVNHSSSLTVTGDLFLEMKVRLGVWGQRQMLMSKMNSALTYGYGLRVETGKQLQLFGANSQVQSNASLPVSDGDTISIRVTRTQADGVTKFFYDNGGGWTQLGDDRVMAAGVSLGSNTDPLYLGARLGPNDQVYDMSRFHYLKVGTDTAGSTLVCDCDFETKTVGDDTVPDDSGNGNVVVISMMQRAGDGRIELASANPGGSGYFEQMGNPSNGGYVVATDCKATLPDKTRVVAQRGTASGWRTTPSDYPAVPWIRQRQWSSNYTTLFPMTPVAGNLLLGLEHSTSSYPSWGAAPAGWTLFDTAKYDTVDGGIRVYTRVADGTETGFTSSTSGGATTYSVLEIAAASGTPLIGQAGKNSPTGSVTTASPNSSPLTAGQVLALGLYALAGEGNGTVSVSAGFGELTDTHTSYIRQISGVAPSSPIQPTLTWASARGVAAQLLLIEAAAGFRPQVMAMV